MEQFFCRPHEFYLSVNGLYDQIRPKKAIFTPHQKFGPNKAELSTLYYVPDFPCLEFGTMSESVDGDSIGVSSKSVLSSTLDLVVSTQLFCSMSNYSTIV